MFGKNPIREDERSLDGLTLAVQEIFYTLQGEGPQSGRPSVFIRLAGCNLACHFCDTEFESKIENRLSIDQMVKLVMSFPHHDLVVLTGGEPLRQNVVPLVNLLLREGVGMVQIETAGTLWQQELEVLCDEDLVQIVCSPKTPNINRRIKLFCEHYKYIIEHDKLNAADGLPIGSTQGVISWPGRTQPSLIYRPFLDPEIAPAPNATIWVSPCDAHGPDFGDGDVITKMNIKAAVQSALTFGHRLSLQVHKLVDLP